MIIIIPIGGIGQRFKDNGYKKPKALINIYGKPIISYLHTHTRAKPQTTTARAHALQICCAMHASVQTRSLSNIF
jgi:GTP:adenosylcobinamide-phosphate guanylyltransferase